MPILIARPHTIKKAIAANNLSLCVLQGTKLKTRRQAYTREMLIAQNHEIDRRLKQLLFDALMKKSNA